MEMRDSKGPLNPRVRSLPAGDSPPQSSFCCFASSKEVSITSLGRLFNGLTALAVQMAFIFLHSIFLGFVSFRSSQWHSRGCSPSPGLRGVSLCQPSQTGIRCYTQSPFIILLDFLRRHWMCCQWALDRFQQSTKLLGLCLFRNSTARVYYILGPTASSSVIFLTPV